MCPWILHEVRASCLRNLAQSLPMVLLRRGKRLQVRSRVMETWHCQLMIQCLQQHWRWIGHELCQSFLHYRSAGLHCTACDNASMPDVCTIHHACNFSCPGSEQWEQLDRADSPTVPPRAVFDLQLLSAVQQRRQNIIIIIVIAAAVVIIVSTFIQHRTTLCSMCTVNSYALNWKR